MDDLIYQIVLNLAWPSMIPVAQMVHAHIAGAATELEYYA